MLRTIALLFIVGVLSPLAIVAQTPSPDDPPPPMPSIEVDSDPLIVLLMGADTQVQANHGRTDVLMLAAINRQAGTVSFLSIPRDLYVAIPEHGVGRINTAYAYGEQSQPGGGPAALIETIRYNLGLDVDYWARVDFADFRQLIDDLGGVKIVVDCAIQDWRLLEPDLDPAVEENWAQFTLPVGVQTMDGDLALWYARSRRTSSDFDRGRRHQALLQAVWRRIRELGLDSQLTAVWPQLLELVDTDMPLEQVLELLPVGVNLSASQIAHFTFRSGVEVTSWRSPEGSSVQAPNREALAVTLRQFLTPPTANQIQTDPITVEVVNASGVRGMDAVAAWRLGWEGIETIIAEPATFAMPYTQLIDLAGQTKGNTSDLLRHALNLGTAAVTVEPAADRIADFRLIVGQNYFPCTYGVMPPSQPG